MSEIIFKQLQAVELASMLEQAGDDPVLGPQLKALLSDTQGEIEQERRNDGLLFPKEIAALPRVAIMLNGGGVQDSTGVRPSLAGAALISYERMFIEQALHDEREFARTAGRQRRPRGAGTPELLFTGTPRGSFGLEFTPLPVGDDAIQNVRAKALENVTNAIVAVASENDSEFAAAIAPIPPGVLQALKGFFKSLAANGAEVRLVSDGRKPAYLHRGQIKHAADRLDRDVKQEEVVLKSVVRGVTRESGYFDLKVDSRTVITGTVTDRFTEDDLETIDRLTNQFCEATLLKTTITTIGGASTQSYILLGAVPVSGSLPVEAGQTPLRHFDVGEPEPPATH